MSERDSDLQNVAQLARLRLDEGEQEQLGAQVERILGYVRKLEEVDVEGVEPTKHVLDRVDVVREDENAPSLPRERIFEQAPDEDDDHFVVPAVMPE